MDFTLMVKNNESLNSFIKVIILNDYEEYL